ncbi:phosphatidylinositol-glycan biosynthesis class f protein-related [Holotrichia oblita]|uniref:Phosphatidylinositol-glycan biosynthesis class f protein-related n=1 Tax=Holotrichia oblita TaxID=644536 RepID=A0ACB9T694_HOLOL|nr:phosphatidylinositol-glycan biosynthesis class f protein-related [Holotrichia oblita]
MISILSLIATVLVIAVCVKIYWKLSTKWNGSYTCLVGIGYYTALDMASRGARVILACRNKERASTACHNIIKATNNQEVVYKLVDLASLRSVRNFAEDINRNEDRLDILINNAGLGFLEGNEYTADGIQYLLHTNHISHFLLTHLLLDKLKESAPSRIINVSSIGARRSKLTVENIDQINKIPPVGLHVVLRDSQLYTTTKLCNILFTTELSRRLIGSGVTVNALHPGVISTEFFRGLTGILKKCLDIAALLLLLTPQEGAQTQIYLAVSRDVEGISGGLFANCERIELYSVAKTPHLAEKLWEKSEELAHLNPNEKIQMH